MPINDFPRESTTPATIPDLAAFEAVVGDTLNFTPQATIGTSTVTLVQKPSGSTASVSSGSFTCDVSGVYLVTLANAGFTRQWTVYCFSASQTQGRATLRAYVQGAGPLGSGGTNALRTTLETAAPGNVISGVNWAGFKPGP